MEGGGVIKFLCTRVTSLFWRWMPSSMLVGTLTFSPLDCGGLMAALGFCGLLLPSSGEMQGLLVLHSV